jgi:ABC-2 type transport system ATP-binding protein
MTATAVTASHLVKSYASKVAVNDLSFTLAKGEILGLIGPNGSGKTTTIRMLLDIIKPDTGSVLILGDRLQESTKEKIGYLPEERGLYKKLSVMDSILYLASLKGMARSAAEARATTLLSQTGLLAHQRKKTEELSKGMGQLVQFIISILHDPELLIFDEPFSGLDPVNTELLKGMVHELRKQGKAIILSTHQMNQVEELCDRMLMIYQGRAVHYGSIPEIKARYRNNTVILEADNIPAEIAGVRERRPGNGYLELVLDAATTPQQLLAELVSRGTNIRRFEIALPSLNEIFLRTVGHESE